jgi:hypothetical protein
MGPKVPRSTVQSTDEETLIVTFRRHTSLPPDDCLYALQATIPHLTRSSLHRLFQCHGISPFPGVESPPQRRQSRAYPRGYVHIDVVEVWTEEDKLYRFVAHRPGQQVRLRGAPRAGDAADFLRRPVERVCPTAFTRS